MYLRRWALRLLGLCALGALFGCGKDFNEGFGELPGWGGYTKGYGDVDEGMDKPIGLCSYTGGCLPAGKPEAPEIGPAKSSDSTEP